MFLRAGVVALAMIGVTGCDQVSGAVTEGLSRIGAPSDATSKGIRTLALMGGDVRVRGPEGYCIDQGASNARRGFAVMVGCALLSEDAGVMPSLDGLIMVQFGAEDTASVSGNEDAFAAFLASDAGRSILAGGRDIAKVTEVATTSDTDTVLARFEDTSGPLIAGTSGLQWRGFADINGRLVTVSVLSFDRDALSRSEGERLLVVALEKLAAVNSDAGASEENG